MRVATEQGGVNLNGAWQALTGNPVYRCRLQQTDTTTGQKPGRVHLARSSRWPLDSS
jgi:hypothetical protein